ncbi:MAG: HAD family hydrolase [Candidatus Binatia bacterium]
MFSWIFLDLGGPVFNDEPWSAHVRAIIRHELAFEGLSAPTERFVAVEREVKEKRLSSFLRTLVRTVCRSETQAGRVWDRVQKTLNATDVDTFLRLNPLQPEAARAIPLLAQQYRLATLSNNLLIANEALKAQGLWQYFLVSGNSAEVGFSKPDPRLFQFVLEHARCQPDAALMVGDRLDNDIIPAKRLGLRTARIRVGWCREVEPRNPQEQPDYEVNSLIELAWFLTCGESRFFLSDKSGKS